MKLKGADKKERDDIYNRQINYVYNFLLLYRAPTDRLISQQQLLNVIGITKRIQMDGQIIQKIQNRS